MNKPGKISITWVSEAACWRYVTDGARTGNVAQPDSASGTFNAIKRTCEALGVSSDDYYWAVINEHEFVGGLHVS